MKEFVRNLSAQLIHLNYRIVNGYGLGFGNEVLNGATLQIRNEHKSFDEFMKIMPFPQGLLDSRTAWSQYRQEMIQDTGISIFVMGNKKDKVSGNIVLSSGMQEEYDISQKNGNFLIPVGATEYKAADLWNQQMKIRDDSFSPTENEMETLNDKSKTLNQHLDTIISILKRIND